MIRGRLGPFAAPLAAFFVLVLTGGAVKAQGTVVGTVTATATGQPLGQARVIVVGGNQVGVSGDDGKFVLRGVPAGSVTIEALHVGYKSEKKSVVVTSGASATADFSMAQAVVQLQEVVTTATGQQRRVELGNAISTLGDVGKKVEETQISTLSDLLIAKAPGVVVLPGAMLGGAPSVRIRGTSSISLGNSPIYVLDGVRYVSGSSNSGTGTSFSFLNSLNPEDIQDIEIVKGPSAATLYGTSAANGVVVITTKKGRAGVTRWNVYAEGGSVQDRNHYPVMYANWGHAPGTTTQIRCQLALMSTPANQGGTPCISDSLTHYLLLRDPERTFIHDGQRTNYGVSTSGGTDQIRFFVAADMSDEYGPLQMPGFEQQRFAAAKVPVRGEWLRPIAEQKLNFRSNLNVAMSPKLDIAVSMGFNKADNRILPTDAAFEAIYYVGIQNYGFKGPGLGKITTTSEGVPLNEFYQYAPGDVMQEGFKQDLQRLTGSVDGNWRPLSWLQNTATVGMDLAYTNFFRICRLNECPLPTLRLGRVDDNRGTNRNFSAKVSSTATWNARPWANLKTSVGADYTNVENDQVTTTGATLPPGGTNVAAAATRNATNTQPSVVKTLGFYVQEQLSLRDRLFLTAAVRTDQNSAFGSNFQSVAYPKASASWIASEEEFFPKYKWLNTLRLRGSFGASGVQPGATTALVTFTAASVSVPNKGTTTGVNTPGLIAAQPGLPDLKPETSKEYEAGFEAQLLNSRVRLDYTYYRRQSYDALVSVPIAPSSAASQLTVFQNVGSIRNSGHELQVGAFLFDRPNFGWDITVNVSHNTNLVVNLGLDPATNKRRIIGAGLTTEQREGLPINGQWYRPYTYEDKNKDGVLQWNSNDALSEVHVDSALKFKGVTAPRDIFSVQQGFDLFKHALRITTSFDYKGGFNVQDGANNFQCNTDPRACAETQNPKSPLNEQARNIAKTYGSTIGGTTYKTAGGYFMSGQFWRWRELSVVYTLPGMATRLIKAATGSSLVVGVRNIHVWTSFTDVDPEINQGLAQNDNQTNFQSAPPPTYITLRLNLKY